MNDVVECKFLSCRMQNCLLNECFEVKVKVKGKGRRECFVSGG